VGQKKQTCLTPGLAEPNSRLAV